MFGSNPQRTFVSPCTGPVTKPPHMSYFTISSDSAGTALANNMNGNLTVYNVFIDGTASAFRYNATGKPSPLWLHSAWPGNPSAHLALLKNTLYFTSAPQLSAYDTTTGMQVWNSLTPRYIVNQSLLIGYGSQTPYRPAVTISRTPTRLPKLYTNTPSFGISEVPKLTPIVSPSRGILLYASLRGLYAININTGNLTWMTLIRDVYGYDAFSLLYMISAPTMSPDEAIVCCAATKSIFCVNATQGQPLWHTDIKIQLSIDNLMISNGTVFARSSSLLSAFNLYTGRQRWNRTLNNVVSPNSGSGGITLLPSLVSRTVDAVAITGAWASLPTGRTWCVLIFHSITGDLIRSINGTVTGSFLISPASVDAMGGLYFLVADQDTFYSTLYRVDAKNGLISYNLLLPQQASNHIVPFYLNVIVFGDKLIVTDFSGVTYLFYNESTYGSK